MSKKNISKKNTSGKKFQNKKTKHKTEKKLGKVFGQPKSKSRVKSKDQAGDRASGRPHSKKGTDKRGAGKKFEDTNVSIKKGDPSYDTTYLAIKHKLPYLFSGKEIAASEAYPTDLQNAELESDRLALFDKDIVTIDGADSKDFDDAISIDKTDKGYDIGVHIADVSHFVKEGSILDKSALKRGNSVYLMDTVFPMFPEKLSNGLCSLNENVVRFTLSAFISIDFEGNIVDYSFSKTAISSKKRLTYDYVADVLDGVATDVEPWLERLIKTADEAKSILLKKRNDDGSLSFELPERYVRLDEEHLPISFNVCERKESHKIVEEFMLLANRVVAKFLSKETASIYRVHDKPDEAKLLNFRRVAYNRGYKLKMNEDRSFDFNSLFAEIAGKDDEKLILTLLLRSQKQAIYDTTNVGHFGLAFDYYTHFTSPIRRYSDLEVHRILKRIIGGGKSLRTVEVDRIVKIADHCSKTERLAVDAERELFKIKSARYMKDHVGKEYDGIISGVTSFGIFVEIIETGIEGLIRYADIKNSYFTFYEEDQCAINNDRTHSFTLGDKITIVVDKVNIERLFIDFRLKDKE